MQNRQFVKASLINKKRYPSVLGLWLFSIPSQLRTISPDEKRWVSKLNMQRSWQYHFSRGCIRYALSNLTGYSPESIPLKAEPGQPPQLSNGWGYISLSHCKDALLIGWSPRRIGVDIERSDREFKAELLAKRFFNLEEVRELKHISREHLKSEILDRWIIKEASIKWQRGTIAKNINKWIWCKDKSFALHKSLHYKVNIYKGLYKEWKFAIAYSHNKKNVPILCVED